MFSLTLKIIYMRARSKTAPSVFKIYLKHKDKDMKLIFLGLLALAAAKPNGK